MRLRVTLSESSPIDRAILRAWRWVWRGAPSGLPVFVITILVLSALAGYVEMTAGPRAWPAGQHTYYNATGWDASLEAAVEKWNSERTGVVWVETQDRASADLIFRSSKAIGCEDCIGLASQIGWKPNQQATITLLPANSNDGARRLEDTYTTVISHELGHVMGLQHTNEIPCALMNGKSHCSSDAIARVMYETDPALPRAWVGSARSEQTPGRSGSRAGSPERAPDIAEAEDARTQLAQVGGYLRLRREIRSRGALPIYCGPTRPDVRQMLELYPDARRHADPLCWDQAETPDEFYFHRLARCLHSSTAAFKACSHWAWGLRVRSESESELLSRLP